MPAPVMSLQLSHAGTCHMPKGCEVSAAAAAHLQAKQAVSRLDKADKEEQAAQAKVWYCCSPLPLSRFQAASNSCQGRSDSQPATHGPGATQLTCRACWQLCGAHLPRSKCHDTAAHRQPCAHV
jgi:hypothetical protein